MESLFVRPREAAAMLGMSLSKIHKVIKAGDLPSRKLGGARYIPRAAVLKLAECESAT